MKNLRIIFLLLFISINFISCSKSNNLETNNNKEGKIDISIDKNKQNIQNSQKEEKQKLENKEYKKIVNEKNGLKNATKEDINKILLQEIKNLNTPISNYIFVKNGEDKNIKIDEIKKSGGIEITRGNIYIHGINKKHNFLYNLLNKNEKLYSFYNKQNDVSLFYLDQNLDDFLNKIKNNYSDFEKITDENNYKEISIKNNENSYLIQININNGDFEDQLDNILEKKQNTKITINLQK